MAVTPEGTYQRMVVANRGSYCFGQNVLFLHMLRGLGYRCAYLHAARRHITKLMHSTGRFLLPVEASDRAGHTQPSSTSSYSYSRTRHPTRT
jgi:arylamine N-acetyltransferase